MGLGELEPWLDLRCRCEGLEISCRNRGGGDLEISRGTTGMDLGELWPWLDPDPRCRGEDLEISRSVAIELDL